MNRQIEAKSKDEAMLRAMIQVNSRIDFNAPVQKVEQRIMKSEMSTKYVMPAYRSNNIVDGRSAAYKASMWLLK